MNKPLLWILDLMIFSASAGAAPPDANCNDVNVHEKVLAEMRRQGFAQLDEASLRATPLIPQHLQRLGSPIAAYFEASVKRGDGSLQRSRWIGQFSFDYGKCEPQFLGAAVIAW